jgi:hypothetical protein
MVTPQTLTVNIFHLTGTVKGNTKCEVLQRLHVFPPIIPIKEYYASSHMMGGKALPHEKKCRHVRAFFVHAFTVTGD